MVGRASAAALFAKQPSFDGPVERGRKYLIVDDHVGLGGTIANLRGFIESRGGQVIGATTLTASRNSESIALQPVTLAALREKHGRLESWWKKKLGHGFDSLTEPEAQHVSRIPGSDEIRDRVFAALSERGAQADGRTDGGGSSVGGEPSSSLFAVEPAPDRLKVAKRIAGIVRQVAPQVDVQVVEGKLGGDRAGTYDPLRRLVTVALSFGDPEVTAGHEAIHALRDVGLFTDQEWALLEKQARERWIDQFGVRELYRGESEETLVEEAVAQAFGVARASWQAAAGAPPAVRPHPRPADRVADALRGMGVRTVEDVFGATEAGEVGRRTPRKAAASASTEAGASPRPIDSQDAARASVFRPGAWTTWARLVNELIPAKYGAYPYPQITTPIATGLFACRWLFGRAAASPRSS